MDKKTVNLEIINGLKSKGINIAEVEKNHLEAFADIMYKAINYTPCCTSEAEQLVCDHPKRQRDYYSAETFKCWKCKKIVVAN